MATEGLFALLCAGALLGAEAPSPRVAADDRDSALATTLAVQTAMQQGRDLLLHNNPAQAAEVLEGQLPHINGNPTYLALLRDAYRAYLKSLRLSGQESRARIYVQRLLILDPSAPADVGALSQRTAAGSSTAPQTARQDPAAAPVFRAKQEDDPFRQTPKATASQVREILVQAEREFTQHKFHDADVLYEQARRMDAHAIDASRERWAYCKMSQVVDQLNHQATCYTELQGQVRAALGLQLGKPLEAYGNQLLVEIERRKAQTGSDRQPGLARVEIQDAGRTAEGWCVAETTNFRILHNASPEWVQETARVAEQTRAEMHQKWFGELGQPWTPKCEIYLHPTGEDYSRATGVSSASPGHSSFQLDGGRVLTRRIDIHYDDPGVLIGVLPHETTHVVLAGKFGDQPVPRWADEGMAVLTEPREKIERHLRNLPQHRQDRQLFPLRQLVYMNDYPAPQYMGPFYAQSVSLVDFLSREKGPEVFTKFLRDGMKTGYDSALRRYYGYRSFDELEQRWHAYAFSDQPKAIGVAQGTR
jgi:hypothetical protein